VGFPRDALDHPKPTCEAVDLGVLFSLPESRNTQNPSEISNGCVYERSHGR
jgi:hypothetical protein